MYHVTSRGNRREEIYLDDRDRELWLELLGVVCDRFGWTCYAYCLMSNHYHTCIESREGNLSKGMRYLNGVFTQRGNRRYKKVGHVFQGRYKAIVVDHDEYLLELCRYIVLNPVRAGMVATVVEWPLSSYASMLSDSEKKAWLAVDAVLARFFLK